MVTITGKYSNSPLSDESPMVYRYIIACTVVEDARIHTPGNDLRKASPPGLGTSHVTEHISQQHHLHFGLGSVVSSIRCS